MAKQTVEDANVRCVRYGILCPSLPFPLITGHVSSGQLEKVLVPI